MTYNKMCYSQKDNLNRRARKMSYMAQYKQQIIQGDKLKTKRIYQ